MPDAPPRFAICYLLFAICHLPPDFSHSRFLCYNATDGQR